MDLSEEGAAERMERMEKESEKRNTREGLFRDESRKAATKVALEAAHKWMAPIVDEAPLLKEMWGSCTSWEGLKAHTLCKSFRSSEAKLTGWKANDNLFTTMSAMLQVGIPFHRLVYS